METIDISPAAESLIRDQLSRLDGIYPAEVNHRFVVDRLNETKHNLNHLLTLNSRDRELSPEDREHFRTIQVAPLVAEPIEAERLITDALGIKEKAAAHLLTHSTYYAEVAMEVVRTGRRTEVMRPNHYYGAPAMFQLNRLHSEGAQHLLELMYHLLCVHTATPLGELLTRIDAQTSVAFAEACQILVTGFQQSESD